MRTYHGATAGQKEKGSGSAGSSRGADERRPLDLHCFKCEDAHRLEDCQFFQDLSISERMSFAQRRGLCYGCFSVRHGTISCTLNKPCDNNGCKLTHHRLLHKESGMEESIVRPHAARSGQQLIAFKMLRLDACTAVGELVPVNILIDEGSDSILQFFFAQRWSVVFNWLGKSKL